MGVGHVGARDALGVGGDDGGQWRSEREGETQEVVEGPPDGSEDGGEKLDVGEWKSGRGYQGSRDRESATW